MPRLADGGQLAAVCRSNVEQLPITRRDQASRTAQDGMSRFLVAMFVGATIAAAASTSASAWHCLAQQPQRRNRHGLRRHTGKGPVNFIAPVHTPRRWGCLHNRMVPAVLR